MVRQIEVGGIKEVKNNKIVEKNFNIRFPSKFLKK
jgi:hypothetical protein